MNPIMQGNESVVELVRRLNSPTYGAPASQLQLAAMRDVHNESSDQSQFKFDTVTTQDVATLSDSLEQLKLDAEAIKILQQRIESRTKRAQKFFHYATAALAPINRFPAEVLARIFVLGKRLELNFSPRMSWVAQRWRDVALSTPELWNTIPLTDLPELTTLTLRFQERLSRKNAQQSCEKVLKALAGARNQTCPKLRTIEIGVLGLGGVVALKGVLESRSLLRSGRVVTILAPDVMEDEDQNKDLAWMRSHLKGFKARGEADEDDEDDEDDDEEDDETATEGI
ncbi:hypothetical protein BN14_04453 [Rhizoctonia solani AG-1 IB]|uniref:Uncharacterized protein n=1 Tax=Thanatephorus cucumeris (strain AG1-IB / isolate 7/3/14) TaxID=1108050 RepID=M5BT80_THACB|nr:hypothetical protein BN14_04453 [Rhizoctonia solani AG-1 IB]